MTYTQKTMENLRRLAALSDKRNGITPEMYTEHTVFRGLRDMAGNGVVTGLTEISTIKAKEKAPDGTGNKILDAARYISDNYDREITLQTAAHIACMEATYFSKCFKQLTGFGFRDYVTQTRLKKAEELLRSSKLSISEISDSCGFLSSNYFGDVFKKYKGISPRSYRKQCQSKKGM